MPFASMSVTSICGTHGRARAMPDRSKGAETACCHGDSLTLVDLDELEAVRPRRWKISGLSRDRGVAVDELGMTPPLVSMPSIGVRR